MFRANTLTAAFVTRMQNESCRASRPGWEGDGQGDAAEPTASPALMGLRPFYVAAARDGEPRHSLLSAGKELLPQELIKNQWAEQDAPEQRTAEKTSQDGQGRERLPRRAGSDTFWGGC